MRRDEYVHPEWTPKMSAVAVILSSQQAQVLLQIHTAFSLLITSENSSGNGSLSPKGPEGLGKAQA